MYMYEIYTFQIAVCVTLKYVIHNFTCILIYNFLCQFWDLILAISLIRLLSKTFKKFQPDVVVCQCGADTLAGDPFTAFNLTLKAPGECIKLFKSWNVPLLALGGGKKIM